MTIEELRSLLEEMDKMMWAGEEVEAILDFFELRIDQQEQWLAEQAEDV